MSDLGLVVKWDGARLPDKPHLDGRTVRLEPLDPSRHGPSLSAAARGDPAIWDYLPEGPFEDDDRFRAWLQWATDTADYLFLAVIEESTGLAAGMASYMRAVPKHGVIEIGYIWFGKQLQRTTAATEAIFLLLLHAFDDWGYRRVEWKCNALNQSSCRAAERFGFQYEGTFRRHMVVKGRNRDTAWFAMLDADWPAIKLAFETWLAPENFDSTGRQRETLAAVRESAS